MILPVKVARFVTDVRGLLPAFLLDDLLQDREPGLLGGFEHLELLLWQLVDRSFLAVALEGARVSRARKDVLLTHE